MADKAPKCQNEYSQIFKVLFYNTDICDVGLCGNAKLSHLRQALYLQD